MANKKEATNQDTLTKDDLTIISSIIIQSTIKGSDAITIASILSKIENMTK